MNAQTSQLRDKMDSLRAVYLLENHDKKTIFRSFGCAEKGFHLEIYAPHFLDWLADKAIGSYGGNIPNVVRINEQIVEITEADKAAAERDK